LKTSTRAVVPPEIRDGLVIGHQFAGQPHYFDVAPRLALQPAARRNAVQVAVDEQLEQQRRVIARPPSPRRGRTCEANPTSDKAAARALNLSDDLL